MTEIVFRVKTESPFYSKEELEALSQRLFEEFASFDDDAVKGSASAEVVVKADPNERRAEMREMVKRFIDEGSLIVNVLISDVDDEEAYAHTFSTDD